MRYGAFLPKVILNRYLFCKRRLTFSTYYAHPDPLFKDLNILTIDQLVVHRIGIAMYKINNDLFPSVLNELYKKNNVIHDHNTRAKDMFRISRGTQTFSTVSARIWNAVIVKFNVMFHFLSLKNL